MSCRKLGPLASNISSGLIRYELTLITCMCHPTCVQLYLASSLLLGAPLDLPARHNEVWDRKTTEAAGIVWRGNHTLSPLPHETMKTEDLPESFSWGDKNLLTMSRNQHIPQCAGRCQPPEPWPRRISVLVDPLAGRSPTCPGTAAPAGPMARSPPSATASRLPGRARASTST